MFSTRDLYNKSVYIEGASKSIGKIRTFIFYGKRYVGAYIKRPDLLWMFRRKQLFLPVKKMYLKEEGIFVRNKQDFSQKNADFEWDKTAIWQNMPVKIGKSQIGFCEDVYFEKHTGNISKISLEKSKVAGLVLGKTIIKAEDIKGFSLTKQAIILNDDAQLIEGEEGVAEIAGKTASKIVHKIKVQTPKATDKIQEQSDKIHKMFKDFKDEFKEGLNE